MRRSIIMPLVGLAALAAIFASLAGEAYAQREGKAPRVKTAPGWLEQDEGAQKGTFKKKPGGKSRPFSQGVLSTDAVESHEDGDEAEDGGATTLRVPILDSETWRPPHEGGDREFAGHGVEVTVKVHFFAVNETLYRRIFMRAFETEPGGGRTNAEGWSPRELIYRAPRGRKITVPRANRGITLLSREILKTHGPHEFDTRVGKVTVYGDHKGKDVGRYTRVTIDFDYELPVVSETVEGARRVQVRFPKLLTLKPRLVEGDAEFKGRGPKVRVDARLEHNAERVSLVVDMKATEFGATAGIFTSPPDTQAEGSEQQRLFTAPEGWRITGIRGQTEWSKIVDYVDRDHSPEDFETEIGEFRIYGDTKGNDVGEYTRLEFRSNEWFVVTMEPDSTGSDDDVSGVRVLRRRRR